MSKPVKEIQKFKEIAKRLSKKSLLKKDLINFFRPIDYVRTVELPAVLNLSKILSNKKEHLKILDISSPQILTASVAELSSTWKITYINPFQLELDYMLKLSNLLSINNIVTKKIDITSEEELKLLDNNFDYIFSSSVFEHIHPEEDGDITAVKNILQLLKPNGIFVLSVPFYKKSFNEYKYGDVYSVKGNENKKIFFQRFYDEETLNRQLIHPSNLILESKLFLGERFYYPNNIHKRFAQIMNSKYSSILFGKFYFLISKLFITYSENYKELKKPYITVVALRKK